MKAAVIRDLLKRSGKQQSGRGLELERLVEGNGSKLLRIESDIKAIKEKVTGEMTERTVARSEETPHANVNVEDRLSKLESDVGKIESDVSEMKSDVSKVITDVSKVKSDVSEMKEAMKKLLEILEVTSSHPK